MLNSFMMDIQCEELYRGESWDVVQDDDEEIAVIGTYALCNWGGFEVGMDENEDMYYRWNDGERVGDWEVMETTFDDDDREWAWNPDQQALLFPLDEVMEV